TMMTMVETRPKISPSGSMPATVMFARARTAMVTLARGRAPKRPSRARVIRLSHSTVRLSVAAIATNPRDTSSPRTAIQRAREGVRPAWMRTRIGRTAAAARTVPAITGHPVPVSRSNPKVRGTGISHSHAMSRLIGSQSNRGLGVSAAAAGGVFDFHDDTVVGGGDVPDRRVLRQVGLPRLPTIGEHAQVG